MAEPRVAVNVTPAQLRALKKIVGWPAPEWLSEELGRASKAMTVAVREHRKADRKQGLTDTTD
jgi:hypothetical protein